MQRGYLSFFYKSFSKTGQSPACALSSRLELEGNSY